MAKRIDAFGHVIDDQRNSIGVPGGDGLLKQFTVALDKSTGRTDVVESDPISIPELVASYEDQCGMEWARRQLRAGQITSEQLADDGKHGGDFSGTTSINVAYRQAKAAGAKGSEVAQSLGIEGPIDMERLDEIVKERVEALVKAQAPAKSTEGEAQ